MAVSFSTDFETNNELDVVLKAGAILMESGAEIYRIEDTMAHMAKALGIRQFSCYVVNRGVLISGVCPSGLKESRILATSTPQINLGKLEAVNRLSRQLAAQPLDSIPQTLGQLEEIKHNKIYQPLQEVIAYFVGSGGFSLALGSSWTDGLAAALSGLFVGIAMQVLSRFIQAGFLQTMLASAIITLSANLLYLMGLGQDQSVIILGALMVLIPGAYFVNAIREFTQNNYHSGLALMLTGISACLSISVGVASTLSVLPFAQQLTGSFATPDTSLLAMAIQTLMAGLGTIAFSVFYQVPKKYFLDLGLVGGSSWLLYLIVWNNSHHEVLAILLPALLVTIASRFLAHKRRCPATVFLASSMFPLIPGMSLYRGTYFLLIGNYDLGIHFMRTCFIAAVTIAIAVGITQQIPGRFFAVKNRK